MTELLHQLLAASLLDQTVVSSISPNLQNDFHSRMHTEAQEHVSDLEVRSIGFVLFQGLNLSPVVFGLSFQHGYER